MTPEAESTFIVSQGKNKCLDAYPMDVFQEKIVSKINEFSESDDAHRYYTSVKGSNSSDAQLDKQGRIAISQKLLDYAGIKRDVLIIGAFNRIEFWEPDARAEYLEKMKNAEGQIEPDLMP